MNKTIIVSLLFLTGCSTAVPIKQKFPDVPKEMLVKCDALTTVNDNTKISDMAKTIANNYKLYHECSIKNEAWVEWYNIQKSIFEEVNK